MKNDLFVTAGEVAQDLGVSIPFAYKLVRQMNEELEAKLKDLKAELFNLRFQLAINQLDNPMRISAVKKDIARVKTVLRENELRDGANA